MSRLSRRYTNHYRLGKPMTLAADHPAVVEGRTLFPGNLVPPGDRVLKSGAHQRKLGAKVVKGRWTGMPIFTLTLEERATCPRNCQHWNDCYGNHMQWPKRFMPGPALQEQIAVELDALAVKYPRGFVVRLHILGDFYSVHYVMEWGRWMQRYANLHVFGYTAHLRDSEIGAALQMVRDAFPARWWIRWSHQDKDDWLSTGESGIVCPVQTNKTDACGTCGLCWTVEKPIKFLVH